MQTFLPYNSFEASARCLDRQRLGKQRLETLQILKTLLGYSEGWKNHPVVRMWKGYEAALCEYGLVICNEWTERGYRDSIYNDLLILKWKHKLCLFTTPQVPTWLGDNRLHQSHQSNLKRKNPFHYRFDVPDNLPYFWPVI